MSGPSVLSSLVTWVTNNPVGSIFLGFMLLGLLIALATNLGIYFWYAVVAAAAAVVAFWIGEWLYFWTFLLGALTAFTEIIGKFRDEPLKSFRTREAVFYHALNGLIAMLALHILVLYKVPIADPLDRMKAAVTASLGAMLVMRSRLFNVKVGNEDISFGSEQFVKVFFRFMEEAIGRVRAQARIEFVKKAVENIDAGKVEAYTLTMLRAVQTLSDKDRQELEKRIKEICARGDDAELRSFALGCVLLDAMGEEFVERLYEERRPAWLIRAPLPKVPVGVLTRVGRRLAVVAVA